MIQFPLKISSLLRTNLLLRKTLRFVQWLTRGKLDNPLKLSRWNPTMTTTTTTSKKRKTRLKFSEHLSIPRSLNQSRRNRLPLLLLSLAGVQAKRWRFLSPGQFHTSGWKGLSLLLLSFLFPKVRALPTRRARRLPLVPKPRLKHPIPQSSFYPVLRWKLRYRISPRANSKKFLLVQKLLW
jgi:hypothetical protein